MYTLILIWGIGFFIDHNVGMRRKKILIVKREVPYDTKTVGNNAKFEDIAEVPIDVQLPDLRVSGGMGRHGAVSSFIGIKRFVTPLSFRICFKLFDDAVCVLWIIFSNKCFDPRGIKDGHVSFGGVNGLADWFGNINEVVENEL